MAWASCLMTQRSSVAAMRAGPAKRQKPRDRRYPQDRREPWKRRAPNRLRASMTKICPSPVRASRQTVTNEPPSGCTARKRAARTTVTGWRSDVPRRCRGRPATSQSNCARTSVIDPAAPAGQAKPLACRRRVWNHILAGRVGPQGQPFLRHEAVSRHLVPTLSPRRRTPAPSAGRRGGWRTGRHGGGARRRWIDASLAPAARQCPRAGRSSRAPTRSRRRGSPVEIAQPGGQITSVAQRPVQIDRASARTQFNPTAAQPITTATRASRPRARWLPRSARQSRSMSHRGAVRCGCRPPRSWRAVVWG